MVLPCIKTKLGIIIINNAHNIIIRSIRWRTTSGSLRSLCLIEGGGAKYMAKHRSKLLVLIVSLSYLKVHYHTTSSKLVPLQTMENLTKPSAKTEAVS